jgi:hypothetical protein
VGPSADLGTVAKRKILTPCREMNPHRPARSLVAISTELLRFFYLEVLTQSHRTSCTGLKSKQMFFCTNRLSDIEGRKRILSGQIPNNVHVRT